MVLSVVFHVFYLNMMPFPCPENCKKDWLFLLFHPIWGV